MTTANLITNETDLAVWMNPETHRRFWKETNRNVFEADDGTKFKTYAAAEAHIARS